MDKWTIIVPKTHYVSTAQKDDICSGNQSLLDAYDHLHMQWLGVDELIRRFSHLYADVIHFDNSPVVSTSLEYGLKAYSNKLSISDQKTYPHDRLKCFLIGCFYKAKKLCRFIVNDRQSGESWTINNEIPLSIWRFNRNNLEVKKDDIDEAEFTQRLYQKVTPNNMKLAMKRFNHEAAIVACALDNCS